MKAIRLLFILATLGLLCGIVPQPYAFAQVPGLATRIDHGPSLPVGAEEYTIFEVTSGTPAIWICDASPCTTSGNWIAAGGSGGTCSGTCANLALSNLSSVAINVPLVSALNNILYLETPNDNGTYFAQAIDITPGAGGGIGGGGAINITGGAGGTSANAGGQVNITGGAGGTGSSTYGAGGWVYLYGGNGVIGGNAYIAGGNSTGSGDSGGTLGIQGGTPGGVVNIGGGAGNSTLAPGGNLNLSGGNAYASTGAGGNVNITSGNGTSQGNIVLTAGAGSIYLSPSAGQINLTTVISGGVPGSINVIGNLLWPSGQSVQGSIGNVSGNGPLNGNFNGKLFGTDFLSRYLGFSGGTAQGVSNWHAEGPYAGSAALSSSNTLSLDFTSTTSPGNVPGIQYSYNGAGTYTVATTGGANSSIAGNAGTASALASTPTSCTGNAVAVGISTNGNAICSTANVIVLQDQSSNPAAISGYGNLWFTSAGLFYNVNGGANVQLTGYPVLLNQDSTGGTCTGTCDVMEQIDGANSETFRVYHSFTSATNFSRLVVAWDSSNGAWELGSNAGSGGGSVGDIEIATGSTPTPHWHFSASSPNALLPSSDNAEDLGCVNAVGPCSASFRLRNIYIGTAISLNGGFGTAGYVICSGGSSSVADYWCANGAGSMVYPGAGIAVSTGSAWGTSIGETDGYIIAGVSGAWTAGTALPSGITAANQSPNNSSSKVANTSYVDTTYMSNWTTIGANLSTSTGIAFNTTTSHAQVFGINLREAVTTTQVTFYLVAGDATGADTYDVGLYQGTAGSTDNLLAHTGAVTATSYYTTGAVYVTIPWTATVTLPPGRYYLALYANEASAPATIGQNSSLDISFYHNSSFSITPSSGALPASITGPTDAYTTSQPPYLALH